MPRKNRRDPAYFQKPDPPQRPRSAAPMWAELPGFELRQLAAEKDYRCPGCDHVVRPGVWHLVVVPDDDPDGRRHWHTECWRRELKRIGRYRAPISEA